MRRKVLLVLCIPALASLHAQTKSAGLGRPANADEMKRRDITVLPTGAGLPVAMNMAL